MLKNPIILVVIDEVVENELSANEEDTTTFKRLQGELEKWGLLDLPVVRPLEDHEVQPGKKWKLIHGRHRMAASKANGETEIHAVQMLRKFEDSEEEFNLVNNMNLIRGEISSRNLTKIIRQGGLDVKKINIFKHPIDTLIPTVTQDDLREKNAEAARNAQINKLTLEVSKEIAKSLVDEKDELITFLIVKDKPVSILRIPFKSNKDARVKSTDIKARIEKAIADIDTA